MGFFQDILFSLGYYKGSPYWSYVDLHHALLTSQSQSRLPLHKLPSAITMHPTFWEKIKEVRGYTHIDMHEYAVSVWFADGDLITTPPYRGDTDSVNTTYNVSLKYLPLDGQYASKVVEVNGVSVLQRSVLLTDIPAQRDLSVLFHLHTHPPYPDGSYSFFSAVDVHHLLTGTFFLTGIITDTCYLLIKTLETPQHETFSDADVSISFLSESLSLGVYRANESAAVFERVNGIV